MTVRRGGREQAYLAALPTVAGWSVDGDELTLLDGAQGVALVYEAPSPTVDLTEADIDTLIVELERVRDLERRVSSLEPAVGLEAIPQNE